MTHPKNAKRLRDVRALLYLLLVILLVLWLASCLFQYLNITGRVDHALRSPARAPYEIAALRSLCEASFFASTMLLATTISVIVLVRRIRKDQETDKLDKETGSK